MVRMQFLSEHELAARSGTTTERIRRLVQLGMLDPGADARFPQSAINRVRLAEALDREGVPLEAMAQAISGGQLSFDFLDHLFLDAVPLRQQTADELAAELGISMEDLARLYSAWSLPAPLPGQQIRDDDARILEALKVFPQTGLDPEVLVPATRFFGDNTRRIAEGQVAFFRSDIIDRLAASGMPMKDVMDAVAPMSSALQPAGRALLAWLHARHFETQVFQETVLIVERIMEEAGQPRGRPVSPPAIAFVDLSGYTLLTERSGDQAAATLAEGLAELVGEAALSHRGRAVKLLGDGVMFYFADPGDAVRCGLAMLDRVKELGLPRARMGVNAGALVFRDGDYFGRTVNVAARITDYARPGEVLVSEDAVTSATGNGIAFTEIGEVLLKGLEEPVRVFRAAQAGEPSHR
jgi:adenylate cyclase